MTTVGVYEAKTHLAGLLDMVSNGKEITITRHSRAVARLVPPKPEVDRAVFDAMRSLRSRLKLRPGETTRGLINEGRRI